MSLTVGLFTKFGLWNSQNLIVKGDKSSNYYSIEKEKYSEVLTNTITEEYKKAPANKENIVTTCIK